MSPELPQNLPEKEKTPFEEKLSQLSRREIILVPEDITPEARSLIRETLTLAGANLNISPETRDSLFHPQDNTFRDTKGGRGVAFAQIFGNSAQSILDDIPLLFPNKLKIKSSKDKKATPGTQGRGLRHLLTILTTLAVDEGGVMTENMVKELNTRLYSYRPDKVSPENKQLLDQHTFSDKINNKLYSRIQKNTLEPFWNYLRNRDTPHDSTNL